MMNGLVQEQHVQTDLKVKYEAILETMEVDTCDLGYNPEAVYALHCWLENKEFPVFTRDATTVFWVSQVLSNSKTR